MVVSSEVVNVLCMKWGTKYPADYVNTLYSMVARNLTREFRFVCLTEDATGLHDQVEVFPLPELSVDLAGPERGWNKLAVFAETLYDLKGKVLCLDLDLIITGSLDELFDYPGEVMIIKDWIKKMAPAIRRFIVLKWALMPMCWLNLSALLNRSKTPIATSRNISPRHSCKKMPWSIGQIIGVEVLSAIALSPFLSLSHARR